MTFYPAFDHRNATHPITLGELRVVHNAVERMAARLFGGPIDENHKVELGFTEHWIVLNIHGRSFGFWRHTMAMYEADEHGAMGDDEVMP
jgi:hypothetical protein